MKLKKSDENSLVKAMKNIRINSKKPRNVSKNVHSGAKIVNHRNCIERTRSMKPCGTFNLNISRNGRRRYLYDRGSSSPTRAYHSDSETVVRRDKDTSYLSQSNLNCEDYIRINVLPNPPPSADEQSEYLSSESSCPIVCEVSLRKSSHADIHMKRLSLNQSSTSLFRSQLADSDTKHANLERSPSLQHVPCSYVDISPSSRTPASDHCDPQTVSSHISCSSGIFKDDYRSDEVDVGHCPCAYNNRASSSLNPYSLSANVDWSRMQIPNSIPYDSCVTMDDLSSYVDLIIHIPKMHI